MENKRYKALCPYCNKTIYVEPSLSIQMGFGWGRGICWSCKNRLLLKYISEKDTINASTMLEGVDLSKFSLPIAVVYQNPDDYPDKYVIRIHESIPSPKATNFFSVHDKYEDCETELKAAGFLIKIPRDNSDDPCIIESWIR